VRGHERYRRLRWLTRPWAHDPIVKCPVPRGTTRHRSSATRPRTRAGDAVPASWTMPVTATMIVVERRARPPKKSAALDKALCDRHGDADASINHPR
jgi:hypothetical protein